MGFAGVSVFVSVDISVSLSAVEGFGEADSSKTAVLFSVSGRTDSSVTGGFMVSDIYISFLSTYIDRVPQIFYYVNM